MPHLDNLRKQAKQFLRWHRDRHHPVAAEIRSTLPRFAGLNDHQILDAPFKLGDAQEMVARKLGYENWTALKAGLQIMQNEMPAEKAPSPSSPSQTDIVATEAMAYVSDFQRAQNFYVRTLGFAVEFAYGEPPFYGLVKRGGARLCLRLICEPVFVGDIREREQLLSAAFTLDSAAAIKALFLEFQAAGVAFQQTLKTEPWGARDFIIRDPDGNLILFAGPAA